MTHLGITYDYYNQHKMSRKILEEMTLEEYHEFIEFLFEKGPIQYP